MTIIGLGVSDNPMVTGFFLILGAVLLVVLNLVENTGFIGPTATVLWLIIAIITIIVKGSNRE